MSGKHEIPAPLPLSALPTEPGEEWRDLPSEDGYAVSSLGRIALTLPAGNKQAGHLKVQRLRKGGMEVRIRTHYRQVGQLVLETFVGPQRPGEYAHRKDFDPAHNTLGNLVWTTRSDAQRGRSVRRGSASESETAP